MSATRCPDCGRFARYDAYYARFWCDFCDRKVPDPPVKVPLIGERGEKTARVTPWIAGGLVLGRVLR